MDDARLEEDTWHDDQDAVHASEVARRRGLVGNAVLAAQDGQSVWIATRRADLHQGMIRVLRFDAQQHHVVLGEANLLDAADGWHWQRVRLVSGDESQTVLADSLHVGWPADQEHVVPSAVKVSADPAADGSCAKDHKPHAR